MKENGDVRCVLVHLPAKDRVAPLSELVTRDHHARGQAQILCRLYHDVLGGVFLALLSRSSLACFPHYEHLPEVAAPNNTALSILFRAMRR
jgi:hypothetical protein